MAVSTIECALMAGAAYQSNRDEENIISFPEAYGWSALEGNDYVLGTDGFEACAFQRGNEIVISFAGTEMTEGDDWQANVALALGVMSDQLKLAAKYYMDIKNANKDASITFTGHSLGGGLAALMGTFFDCAVQAFDQAPFAPACSFTNAFVLRNYLSEEGYSIPDSLAAFSGLFVEEFNDIVEARASARIQNVAVAGEALRALLGTFNRLGPPSDVLVHGGVGLVGVGDLHSIALLIALQHSEKFLRSTLDMPYLLKNVFDPNLFFRDVANSDPDFLNNLVRYEFGIPGEDGTDLDLLTKFGNDTFKLGGVLSEDRIIIESLLQILMTHYYESFKPVESSSESPKELFTEIGGGLQMDLIGNMSELDPLGIKGYAEMCEWLLGVVGVDVSSLVLGFMADLNRVTLGLYSYLVADMQSDETQDFMLSGLLKGVLYGGGGDDFLAGRGAVVAVGAGDDTLVGGTGNDTLAGGVGNDRYEFNEGDGVDLILDSDGKGAVYIDGQALQYAYHMNGDAANTFRTVDGLFLLKLSGEDLVIERIDADDKITIKNFDRNAQDFGIILDDAPTGGYSGADLASIFFRYLNAAIDGVVDLAMPPSNGVVTTPEIQAGNGNDIIFRDGISVNIQAYANADDGLSASGGYISLVPQSGLGGDDIIVDNQHRGFIEGGQGNDILLGGDGDDLLVGDKYIELFSPGASLEYDNYESAFDGNDLLNGGDGNDIIYGGGGDDLLLGSYGKDFLAGGTGSDHLYSGAGDDRLYGDYVVWVPDPSFEVDGSAHLEFHVDTNKNYDDFLDGGDGNDTIEAMNGADRLYGGKGDDTLWGDNSVDGLVNEGVILPDIFKGNDFLDGGEGNDTLSGGGGSDTLFGGEGNDYLEGDTFGDSDTVQGADTLDGGAGNDKLYGNGGSDLLLGGDGNDTLIGDTGFASGLPEGADTLDGGIGNDTLWGDGGNDSLIGGAGVDALQGGDGDDTYIFGRGDSQSINFLLDTVNDAVGNTRLVFDSDMDPSEFYVFIGSTHSVTDLVFKYSATDYVVVLNGFNLNVSWQFGDGPAWSFAQYWETQLSSAPDIVGGSGNDNLVGGHRDEIIYGGQGDDIIDGGIGDDSLFGGAGNDTFLFGRGGGQDAIVVKDTGVGKSDILQLSAGISATDVVVSRASDNLVLTIAGTHDRVSVQNYFRDDAQDAAYQLQQIRFADGVTVWDVDTVKALSLQGSAAAQTITGFSSSDVISALAGDDTVYGRAGDDIIDGGIGNDVLQGDTGSDTYLFGIGSGQDVIANNDGATNTVDCIVLGAGISSADVTVHGVTNGDSRDALLTFASGDSLLLRGYLDDESAVIDEIRFADGEVWTADMLDDKLFPASGSDDVINGSERRNRIFGLGGNDRIYGKGGDDTLDGGAGSDTLDGGWGNDTLRGGTERDVLIGGTGDDVLDGGGWVSYDAWDTLDGGAGNDTYIYGRNSGHDWIFSTDHNSNKRDIVLLAEGVLPEDVVLKRVDYRNLSLRINGSDSASSELLIEGFFHNDAVNPYRIERIVFFDGTIWDVDFIKAMVLETTAASETLIGYDTSDVIHGGDGHDSIDGNGGSDALFGEEGNDHLDGGAGSDELNGGIDQDSLYGGDGDDTLVGGSGDDWLSGSAGGDTYLFSRGFGHDSISESGYNDIVGSVDRIRFDSTIVPADVLLSRSGDNLIITIDDGADEIRVYGQFSTQSEGETPDTIEQIIFSDGTVWGVEEIAGLLQAGGLIDGTNDADTLVGNGIGDTIFGYDGNDVLQGLAGDDSLSGGKGNDLLEGGAGDDYLLGDDETGGSSSSTGADHLLGGDGNDTLLGGRGNDTLDGGAGDDLLGSREDYYSSGRDGVDTYIYGRGAGNDTILHVSAYEPFMQEDVIQLGAGLTEADISFSLGEEDEADLVITINDTREYLTVRDFFASSWSALATYVIRFDNGDLLTSGEIFDRLFWDSERFGGAGDDTVIGAYGNDTLWGLAGADYLAGFAGNDILQGGDGNDSLNGGSGNDTLTGGAGSDTYYLSSGADTILDTGNGPADSDTIYLYNDPDYVDVVRDGDDLVIGEAGGTLRVQNYFVGDGSSSSVRLVRFESGLEWDRAAIVDIIENGRPGMVLNGTEDQDELFGLAGNDTLFGFGGRDVLDGGIGKDTLAGGASDDTYWVDNSGDVVIEDYELGTDVVYSSVDHSLAANVEDLVLVAGAGSGTGNALRNNISGNSGANYLQGLAGDDQLFGGEGNDSLRGGAGDDTLTGEDGADTYFYDLGDGTDLIRGQRDSDVLRLGAGIGTGDIGISIDSEDMELSIRQGGEEVGRIRLQDQIDDSLYGYTGIKQVVFADGTVWDEATLRARTMLATEQGDELYGYSTDDVILGFGGNDNIYGNLGDDELDGGAGNDYLNGGSGSDVLMGGDGDDRLSGGSGNDVLAGGDGIDIMEGGDGDDTLIGGDGNDLFSGEDGDDVMTGGAGNDWFEDWGGDNTYVFGRGSDRDLVLVYSETQHNVEFLAGIAPADVMASRQGDHLILNIVGSTDRITFAYFYQALGASLQSIRFADETVWDSSEIETRVLAAASAPVTLSGTSGADLLVGLDGDDELVGLAGNDTLNGVGGADLMIGGTGDDVYYRDSESDVIQELADEGIDTVISEIDYVLGDNLEKLVLEQLAVSGTGNSLDNVLIGHFEYNRLDGGVGADTMIGGGGYDEYWIDNIDDVVIGLGGGIYSSIDYTLSENIDDLFLIGSDTIDAFGNARNNRLSGNTADNTLAGAGGHDIYEFSGVFGSDVIDDSDPATADWDSIHLRDLLQDDVSYSRSGDDLVISTANGQILVRNQFLYEDVPGEQPYAIHGIRFADYSYLAASDIAELAVSSEVFNGNAGDDIHTGGAGADSLYGNGGNDTLDGGAGDDILDGGVGADTLIGGDGIDTASYTNAGEGVLAALDDGSGSGLGIYGEADGDVLLGIENLVGSGFGDLLFGSTGDNTIRGGAGDDQLDGFTGADLLDGGEGDDLASYRNSSAGVSVNLLTGLGAGGDAEGDVLVGIENVYGSDFDDTLIGTSASNTLLGFDGDDVIRGGGGGDYLMGNAGSDTVSYAGLGEGVQVALQWDGVLNDGHGFYGESEDILESFENIIGTDYDDLFYGSDVANTLSGGTGSDTLVGWQGADRLIGGSGSDAYFFQRGDGQDVLVENDASATDNTDVLYLGSEISSDQLWFRHVGNDLEVSVIGTTDKMTIVDWYSGTAHRVEQFDADGKMLLDSQVENLVSAMSAFSPPGAGETTLPPTYQSALAPVLAANWQ